MTPADGETETDRLARALAAARGDLALHAAALSRLQDELMASRLEVAGARGETVQFRSYLRQSQADVESAHAHIGELRDQAAAREAASQGEAAVLRAELAAVHSSLSWRLTRPVRAAGRVARWCKRAIRPGAPGRPQAAGGGVTPSPPPALATSDPNASCLFRPAPFPDAGEGVVTVEELHHLSRLP